MPTLGSCLPPHCGASATATTLSGCDTWKHVPCFLVERRPTHACPTHTHTHMCVFASSSACWLWLSFSCGCRGRLQCLGRFVSVLGAAAAQALPLRVKALGVHNLPGRRSHRSRDAARSRDASCSPEGPLGIGERDRFGPRGPLSPHVSTGSARFSSRFVLVVSVMT